MKHLHIIIYLLWAFSNNIINAQFIGSEENEKTAAKPLKYEILLEPEIDNEPPIFHGNITIEFIAIEQTNEILLSAGEFHINRDEVTLRDSNDLLIPIFNVSSNSYFELLKIIFENSLNQNEIYRLTMTYSGKLRTDNKGFYIAKYKDEEGIERKLATTMFTKTNAHLAFPCFDEPALKAQFTIKIIRPNNYMALSNEEKLSTEDLGNNRYLDVFRETCNMSTYLVAFTISEFKNTSKNGIHQIFAREQAIKEGKAEYALEKSRILLKAVEDYFDMEYDFPKLDHVAVPDDYFKSEAMENWGLITYNERTLLISNKTFTTFEKQTSLTSILHELIHQWFGNLVTPSKWKFLWLSEGFATYLQFRLGDMIMPEWKLIDQFSYIIQDRCYEGESSFFRTSLNDEGQSDWVAYLKAASVIKMVEHFVTPSVFKESLQIYLKNNQYGSTKPSDLYLALEKAVDKNNKGALLGNNKISDIMKTWDTNVGYPILNVTRNYETGKVTFEQNTFVPYEFMRAENSIWYIPINYVFNVKSEEDFLTTTADFWLTEKKITRDDKFAADGWLIVNKQNTGYYRVNYDVSNWNRIISFLKSEDFHKIHILNRAQLLSDSFDLARYDNLNYNIPLSLSEYLIQERDYAPLSSFFNSIDYINKCLSTSNLYSNFKNYVVSLLNGVLDHLGYEEIKGEDHLDTINRVNVLKWLCNLGHANCSQTALNKLRNWKMDETAWISPNLQEAYLCGGIRAGNQEDWNFLLKKYETAEDTVEKVRYIKALSCSEDENVLTDYFEKIRDLNSTLKQNDRITAIISIIESGNKGLEVATNYIRKYFREFWKMESMDVVLNMLGSRMTSRDELEQFKKFKSEYAGVHMAFRPGMALASINLEWLNRSLPQITNWFNDRLVHITL